MTPEDFLAILPITALTVWACVLLLIEAFLPPRGKPAVPWLTALGLLVALAVVVLVPPPSEAAFGGMIRVDGFGRFLEALFLLAGLLAVPLAVDYNQRRGIARGEYYLLLLFSIVGMMLMAIAADLLLVFLALELLSIPLYVLAAFAWPRAESEESGMKYFLLGAFASAFFVYGTALVYGTTGTTNLYAVLEALVVPDVDMAVLAVAGAMLLVGLGFKVAAVPFHMWTPDVYDGAPSSAVAFMAVGAKAAGFAVLLRLLLTGFPLATEVWGPMLAIVSALTMIWGNVAAIAQTSIKRMLAYSSIAHAGYLLMAVSAGATMAAPGSASAALFYLLAYGVTTIGAWSVVVALERFDGTGTTIDSYAGLGRRRPWIALAMTVFMLSLIGVPPTLGFLGKFLVFGATVDAGLIALAVIGVLTSLVSAFYYLRVVVTMYMRGGEPETSRERWLTAVIALTALATFLLGLLPGPLLELAAQAGLSGVIP
ncbi:MAG TPA: NADH-quinone oxidoreductase subunit N [Anaerolineales bacterium]|nr:NADH-quinone oxidoreductase subunit N [Anaerolineales bacterium]